MGSKEREQLVIYALTLTFIIGFAVGAGFMYWLLDIMGRLA